ncbi:nitrilase-related carbon-nitrogen hydrolase [Nocardia sp. NPDC049149]|uniref:nitrilase-related carbon-nitrogen hydrolase n=1 Tax=Nocardia sp. NPDC049149 TaxID=3364315 RepID=UPI003715727B
MIQQYTAIALQPAMRGCQSRADIKDNLDHISELMDYAVSFGEFDLPVRLITIPEGALQGFTDEVFDWPHERYVEEMAIDLPGDETRFLGAKARQHNAYVVCQAKVRHPEFPGRYFNSAFILGPDGELIHKYYKLQVFAREHSTVPHDVWDRWVELYGNGLDAFYPVADTDIGRIGTIVCQDGSFPETARGLAMNGAEIIYRPSYPEPWVSSGWWEIQNRARALDNTCYVISPNVASYRLTPESRGSIDGFGGKTMIVDYHGQVMTDHPYSGSPSFAAAIFNIESLRDLRARSLWSNWLKDMRTEQFRLIYDQPIWPKNRCLDEAPPNHAAHDELRHEMVEELTRRGVYAAPDYGGAKPETRGRS